MSALKGLAVVALLFGGSSLALAQTPPTTGASPPANITTGPGGAPAYTSGQTAPSKHAATHHKKTHMSAKSSHPKKMYMSAKGTHHHKGSKLTPADNGKPNMKQ
jgi:hypothetical protein